MLSGKLSINIRVIPRILLPIYIWDLTTTTENIKYSRIITIQSLLFMTIFLYIQSNINFFSQIYSSLVGFFYSCLLYKLSQDHGELGDLTLGTADLLTFCI